MEHPSSTLCGVHQFDSYAAITARQQRECSASATRYACTRPEPEYPSPSFAGESQCASKLFTVLQRSHRSCAIQTRSLPDSPMSHPAFPVTMSSDSLRRRLTQQSHTKPSEQQHNKQITASGENEKGQTSQPNSSRQPEQATPSRLPLSRLLQKQSQLSASQTLGLLAPSPSLSNSYLSRSGAESLTTTGFSLPTPARTLEDEDFGSLRASSSRRYQGSGNKDFGGVSADALQSYRARHPDNGTLGRSTAGSAVDRVRALSGLKTDGDGSITQDDGLDMSQRQMVAA